MNRGLDDILKAERNLREMAEDQNRALRKALMELAYRLAGGELEEARKRDPKAPDNWSAEDWRRFFTENVKEGSGWEKPEVLRSKLALAEKERAVALVELEKTKRRLKGIDVVQAQVERGNGSSGISASSKEQDTRQDTTSISIMGRNGLPEIPRKPPTRYASRLSTGKRWRREAMALYLMAKQGLSLRLEILEAIAEVDDVKARSGSLKRMIVNGLIPKGLATGDNLRMHLSQPAQVAVLHLTDDGKDLCRILGWEPVESEWERLIRLHRGNSQGAHTAGVLAFAYHSRRRGWKVEVLPPVEGKSEPDVMVEKGDEKIYVEVEFGSDKPAKWRNLANLQGFVALCAATEDKRSKLVAECKLDRLKGRATDIETLIKESGGVVGNLWHEKW
jgi:hypothetical protein